MDTATSQLGGIAAVEAYVATWLKYFVRQPWSLARAGNGPLLMSPHHFVIASLTLSFVSYNAAELPKGIYRIEALWFAVGSILSPWFILTLTWVGSFFVRGGVKAAHLWRSYCYTSGLQPMMVYVGIAALNLYENQPPNIAAVVAHAVLQLAGAYYAFVGAVVQAGASSRTALKILAVAAPLALVLNLATCVAVIMS